MIFGHALTLVGFGLILMVLGTASLLAAPAAGTGGGTGTAGSGRAVGSLGFTPAIAPFGATGGHFGQFSGFGTAAMTHGFTPFYQNSFAALPHASAVTNGFTSMVPTFKPATSTFTRADGTAGSLSDFSSMATGFAQTQNVPFSQFYVNSFGQTNRPFTQFYQNSFGVTLPTFDTTTTPATPNVTTTVTPNFGATSPHFQALYSLTP
jgi:hypothetical protein